MSSSNVWRNDLVSGGGGLAPQQPFPGQSLAGSGRERAACFSPPPQGSQCGSNPVLGVRAPARSSLLSVLPVADGVPLCSRRLFPGCDCCWCQAAASGWLSVQTSRLILRAQEHLEAFADVDEWVSCDEDEAEYVGDDQIYDEEEDEDGEDEEDGSTRVTKRR